MLDLLLRGGTVVDGTGAPAAVGDVGVRDGRIVAAGQIDESATRTIDATGKVVCPGFVDLHTHYDAQLLWDTTASPSVLHGVTTVLGGNCGFSIAPLGADDADYIRHMMAVVEGIPIEALESGGSWDWASFSQYLTRIDVGLAVNAGFLVGHSTIRRVVMGETATREAATPEQLAEMVRLVEVSVAGGALGLSSSLGEGHVDGDGAPVPSRSATFEEFVALAGAVRSHPGTTLEFIPTVGPIPADRMELMADMSLAADRPLNWNLLGSLASEEIYDQQLQASDVAAEKGAHVVALTLPDLMRMRATTVLAGLPGWGDVLALGDDARAMAVADAETRGRLRAEAERAADRALGVLSDFALMEVSDPGSEWVGRSLGEVAATRHTDVIDVLIDVVLVDGLTLFLVLPSLTPSLGRTDEGWRVRSTVWKDRRVMLGGSDAGAHVDLMCHANYPTVVLGEAVRQRGLLSVEEAVEMLCDRPARHYGLRRRGRIAPGWHADLCVFDPATVASQPAELLHDLPGGGERLSARSLGIDHVFVGGREVVSHGEVTDERPGAVLRSGRDTETVSLADVRR
ncbi:MAG TPA: amidohydrolase family protein [Acidimicrobiales bacterium]|nr:amidohydrolase family protein [Acidimicrobiales bacterium]